MQGLQGAHSTVGPCHPSAEGERGRLLAQQAVARFSIRYVPFLSGNGTDRRGFLDYAVDAYCL